MAVFHIVYKYTLLDLYKLLDYIKLFIFILFKQGIINSLYVSYIFRKYRTNKNTVN